MTDRDLLVVVQARCGSRRLPGKALRPFRGEPLILSVLRRAAAVGPVCLATSVSVRDDLLAETAKLAGYSVARGSEQDVLGRIAQAVRDRRPRAVLRLTGDCPLLAPDVCRRVIRLHRERGVPYASNDTFRTGWPDGLDAEVFDAALLYAADRQALDQSDREHVTPWMRRHAAHAVLWAAEQWMHLKLSVDSVEDYDRVRAVAGCLVNGGLDWASTRAAVLKFVADRPVEAEAMQIAAEKCRRGTAALHMAE